VLRSKAITQPSAMKLYGMDEAFGPQLAKPETYDPAFEERLGLLVDRECALRENGRVQRTLQADARAHSALAATAASVSADLPRSDHVLRVGS
jgi:hypothetical protein